MIDDDTIREVQRLLRDTEWSPHKIAQKTGVGKSTVYAVDSGKRRPKEPLASRTDGLDLKPEHYKRYLEIRRAHHLPERGDESTEEASWDVVRCIAGRLNVSPRHWGYHPEYTND